MKKITLVLFLILLSATVLAGCSTAETSAENHKLSIMTTIFPYYDFAREIGGDKVDVNMLVPAGSNTHSFEPVASDILNLEKSDIFLYNGGEQEQWVKTMLKSIDSSNITAVSMFDCVELLEEETVEGMTTDNHPDHDDEEFDEHIWTSPLNAIKISEKICETLKAADPDNAEYYENNYSQYCEKLNNLDSLFRETVENGNRKYIVVGDSFPLRYFVHEYGLEYTAAFSGCGSESEPSAKALAYIIDKVNEDNIPVVYYIENSSEKVADTICNATGAEKLLFHSCHNVTKTELENGATYLSLMEQNVENLKKGLE